MQVSFLPYAPHVAPNESSTTQHILLMTSPPVKQFTSVPISPTGLGSGGQEGTLPSGAESARTESNRRTSDGGA
jgi:hypothetical protein